jgi:hypothetical protein
MIDYHTTPVQFCGDRSITIRAHLQSYALDLGPDFDVVVGAA